MSHSPDCILLTRRCFTGDLQKAFSGLSGDYNPMHDDPVAARRTLAGGQVVHGIHQALAALEGVLAHKLRAGLSIQEVTDLEVLFKKPVLVGDTVGFYLARDTDEGCEIIGRINEYTVSITSVRWGKNPTASQIEPPSLIREAIAELQFDELPGKAGSLALGLDKASAERMFPLALSALGPMGFAEVLSLSRLVGMHCPGLHSIFSQCVIKFREPRGGASVDYRVEDADERYGRVVMEVRGSCIEGQVTAFFRPPPQKQAGMAETAHLVKAGSFARSVALIVGGSRGLGEVTARLIAAGGGLPIITWHQGAADAERIADDIRDAGGRCEVLQLDVRDAERPILQLTSKGLTPRSLYYFATPRIFGRRRGFFDHDLEREFHEIYVTAFGRLLDCVVASGSTRLRVFYPSSIAVTETMREVAEYAIAKRAGEEMCEFYNRYAKQIEIVVERLPRIRTDQTSTILAVPSEDGLEVMLPLVHRMEAPCQE